jgi:hypothetical protein
MDPKLLHILQHSLGLDHYGNGRQYRNHYVAGGDAVENCRALVAAGYMEEYRPSALSGGDPVQSRRNRREGRGDIGLICHRNVKNHLASG